MAYYAIHNEIAAEEILVYLRKSRSDDPTLTVEEVLQRHQKILEEWVERNLSKAIPQENFFREVVSGEQLDTRPEIMKVLKLIESPKIKAILVVEPQRLSRGDLEDCGRLIKLLRYTDTKVITPTKTYDISDEYDRDSFERELKRGNEYLEYTKKILKRGKIQSVKDGNYLGSVPPYGYEKTFVYDGRKKCPTLKINQKEAEVVRYIFNSYLDGKGVATICMELAKRGCKARNNGVWERSTIYGILNNVLYAGKVKYGHHKYVHDVQDYEVTTKRKRSDEYLIADGKHEAIISWETFQLCAEKLKQTQPPKERNKLTNPLASLLYCEECGCAMVYRNDANIQARFFCRRREVHRSGSIYAQKIFDDIAEALEAEIPNFQMRLDENADEEIKRKEQTIAMLQKRLMDLEQKEVSLWEKYTEDAMPKEIFDKIKDKITKEKNEVTLSLQEEQQKTIAKVDYAEKIVTFQNAIDALRDKNASTAEQNALLRACISRITFRKEPAKRIEKRNDETNDCGWIQTQPELKIELKV